MDPNSRPQNPSSTLDADVQRAAAATGASAPAGAGSPSLFDTSLNGTRRSQSILASLEGRDGSPSAPPAHKPVSPWLWGVALLALASVGAAGYWVGRSNPDALRDPTVATAEGITPPPARAAVAPTPVTSPLPEAAATDETAPTVTASADTAPDAPAMAMPPASEAAVLVDTLPRSGQGIGSSLAEALEEDRASPSASVLNEALAAPVVGAAAATAPVATAPAEKRDAAVAAAKPVAKTAAPAKPKKSAAKAQSDRKKPRSTIVAASAKPSKSAARTVKNGKPVSATGRTMTKSATPKPPTKPASRPGKLATKLSKPGAAVPKRAASDDGDVNIMSVLVEHVNREDTKPAAKAASGSK